MKIKKRERNLKLDLEARKLTRNGTTVKNKNISEHTHTHIPTKTLNTLQTYCARKRERKSFILRKLRIVRKAYHQRGGGGS